MSVKPLDNQLAFELFEQPTFTPGNCPNESRLVDMGVVRICDVCGKPFRTADKYRRNAKRCSWECKMEANRIRARESKRKKRKS